MVFQDTGPAIKYPQAQAEDAAPSAVAETSFMAEDPAIVAVRELVPPTYQVVASLPDVPPETTAAPTPTPKPAPAVSFQEKPKRPPPPKSSLHSTPYDYMMSKVSNKLLQVLTSEFVTGYKYLLVLTRALLLITGNY